MVFTEVVHGYESEEGIEILRAAESDAGDRLFLLKKEDTEEYQLSLELADGRVGADLFTDLSQAGEEFDKILNGQV